MRKGGGVASLRDYDYFTWCVCSLEKDEVADVHEVNWHAESHEKLIRKLAPVRGWLKNGPAVYACSTIMQYIQYIHSATSIHATSTHP